MTHRDFWDNGYRVFGLHGFKQKNAYAGNTIARQQASTR